MKAKKAKIGRPIVKDKKIIYSFTIVASAKKSALKNIQKEELDKLLRKTVHNYAI